MNKDFVINQKTGRVVNKKGAVGKKIITASSAINQAIKMKIARKELEKAKAEAEAKPKKKKDTNRLHNLPDDIQKQIMEIVKFDLNDFESVKKKLDEVWKEISDSWNKDLPRIRDAIDKQKKFIKKNYEGKNPLKEGKEKEEAILEDYVKQRINMMNKRKELYAEKNRYVKIYERLKKLEK